MSISKIPFNVLSKTTEIENEFCLLSLIFVIKTLLNMYVALTNSVRVK